MSDRPNSLSEIAQRTQDGHGAFDRGVREFLDQWQFMSISQRTGALAAKPDPAGAVQDAYLAALGEHLALLHDLPVPAWTDDPDRFLREPFFAGGLESLKAILLVESPLAFRRRLIFISADALSRPPRETV